MGVLLIYILFFSVVSSDLIWQDRYKGDGTLSLLI